MQKRIIASKQQKASIGKSQLGTVAHMLVVLKITNILKERQEGRMWTDETRSWCLGSLAFQNSGETSTSKY